MDVKIRKGDTVEVISGRAEDKGKRGEVIKVLPEERRIVVQGIHMLTKHQKQTQSQGRTINPGKLKFEGPISISNVMLVCKNATNPPVSASPMKAAKCNGFAKNARLRSIKGCRSKRR